MSNTHKDKPYWVRTNNPAEHREENHDHRHLGEVRYWNKPVLDVDGKPVMKQKPIMGTPKQLVEAQETRNRFYYIYPLQELKPTAMKEARYLISAGKGDEEFIIGYQMVRKTVKEILYIIPEECTINSVTNTKNNLWSLAVPCYYSLHYSSGYYRAHPNAEQKKQYHSVERLKEKTSLKTWANSTTQVKNWMQMSSSPGSASTKVTGTEKTLEQKLKKILTTRYYYMYRFEEKVMRMKNFYGR